jgi:ferredoxin-NADP reductase
MSARLVMKLEVVEVHELSPDVRRFVLRHTRRPTLPPPEPGSHVDVRLADGRVRQYSLCGDPDDPTLYSIAIKAQPDGRGGSTWLHAHLKPGVVVPVSAPRNHFALANDARHHILIAGGIGITPMVAMAWRLQREGPVFRSTCWPGSKRRPVSWTSYWNATAGESMFTSPMTRGCHGLMPLRYCKRPRRIPMFMSVGPGV